VLALAREGYRKEKIVPADVMEMLAYSGFLNMAMRYWKTGLGEVYRSFSKRATAEQLRRLIPELKTSDLLSGGAGVRAMAVSKDGKLLDDFVFEETDKQIHVINAPSPAATACLSIGDVLMKMIAAKLNR